MEISGEEKIAHEQRKDLEKINKKDEVGSRTALPRASKASNMSLADKNALNTKNHNSSVSRKRGPKNRNQ